MKHGSEVIYYTPVDAYGVTTFSDGIISGGMGDDVTITQQIRFFWRYDPSSPDKSPSGFTGMGWFENVAETPIVLSGIPLSRILSEFENESRNNLNDVFQIWQSYVNQNSTVEHDIVKNFLQLLLTSPSCYGFVE